MYRARIRDLESNLVLLSADLKDSLSKELRIKKENIERKYDDEQKKLNIAVATLQREDFTGIIDLYQEAKKSDNNQLLKQLESSIIEKITNIQISLDSGDLNQAKEYFLKLINYNQKLGPSLSGVSKEFEKAGKTIVTKIVEVC